MAISLAVTLALFVPFGFHFSTLLGGFLFFIATSALLSAVFVNGKD
jgi:hypothetical protein